MINEFEIIEKK